MSEETKPEEGKDKVGQGKNGEKEQPKDFKIGEIWIKNDTVALDAVPGFWMDKLRALGILEYCKEIVKEYNPQDKKRIIRPPAGGLGGFRNIFKKGKR